MIAEMLDHSVMLEQATAKASAAAAEALHKIADDGIATMVAPERRPARESVLKALGRVRDVLCKPAA